MVTAFLGSCYSPASPFFLTQQTRPKKQLVQLQGRFATRLIISFPVVSFSRPSFFALLFLMALALLWFTRQSSCPHLQEHSLRSCRSFPSPFRRQNPRKFMASSFKYWPAVQCRDRHLSLFPRHLPRTETEGDTQAPGRYLTSNLCPHTRAVPPGSGSPSQWRLARLALAGTERAVGSEVAARPRNKITYSLSPVPFLRWTKLGMHKQTNTTAREPSSRFIDSASYSKEAFPSSFTPPFLPLLAFSLPLRPLG